MRVPTTAEIEDKLSREDLDAWLRLWWTEQGPAKPAALDMMAAVIPGTSRAKLRVLDLCCGPGDAGRAIHARFPKAEIDGIDRDIFLSALCRAVNRKAGIAGQVITGDLYDAGWRAAFKPGYDIVVVANALHWLRLERVKDLLPEVLALLSPGGVFLVMEPVSAEPAFAKGFEAWRETQPSQHSREDWLAFWTRINDLLGYDHIGQMGSRDDPHIGDSLSALGWVALIREAGFESVDVLLRDPEKVIVAAVAPDRRS